MFEVLLVREPPVRAAILGFYLLLFTRSEPRYLWLKVSGGCLDGLEHIEMHLKGHIKELKCYHRSLRVI